MDPRLSYRSLFNIIKRRRCGERKCGFCLRGVAISLGSALGSTWFHEALDVLFAALWLGSCLVAITTEMGGQWIAGTTVQCSC